MLLHILLYTKNIYDASFLLLIVGSIVDIRLNFITVYIVTHFITFYLVTHCGVAPIITDNRANKYK